MLHQTLPEFYTRELLKLKTEINLYKNEADLWVTKNEISNSAGKSVGCSVRCLRD